MDPEGDGGGWDGVGEGGGLQATQSFAGYSFFNETNGLVVDTHIKAGHENHLFFKQLGPGFSP